MTAIGNQTNTAVGNWSAGRTIWIVDAHGYGKRFIVRADEKADGFSGSRTSDTRVRGGFDL